MLERIIVLIRFALLSPIPPSLDEEEGNWMTMKSRKHPAHPAPLERNGRPIIIMVTVCTKIRENMLANPEVHQVLRNVWAKAGNWLVGRYVIMPDHIHLFCRPGVYPPESLTAWVAYWKSLFRRAGLFDHLIWQSDIWDTQMRDHRHYADKWAYVKMNPVRKGLVETPAQWPYKGELHLIHWH